MSQSCDEYQVLITGQLDGELDEAGQRRLEEHMRGCSVCRREFEAMKSLVVGTSAAFGGEEPPEEEWNTFLDAVYNRLERKTGWIFFIVGGAALVCFCLALFALDPSVSRLTKVLIGLSSAGLVLLFISVLRQRLRIAKTDRYSKEVHR